MPGVDSASVAVAGVAVAVVQAEAVVEMLDLEYLGWILDASAEQILVLLVVLRDLAGVLACLAWVVGYQVVHAFGDLVR